MTCGCSLCLGVPSVDPTSHVARSEGPSIADRLRVLGLLAGTLSFDDAVRKLLEAFEALKVDRDHEHNRAEMYRLEREGSRAECSALHAHLNAAGARVRELEAALADLLWVADQNCAGFLVERERWIAICEAARALLSQPSAQGAP